jgi:hypothetical protein
LRLWRVAASRLGATAAGAKAADRPQRPGERQLAALLSITFLLLAVGGLAAGSYHLNGKNRRMLYMDYYCVHEQWADLIEQSAQLPAEDYAPAINYEVNLALHMTNRLGDEMFNFPQKGAVVLDMKNIVSPPYMRAMADMCLRLGRANDAEHFAFEALAMVPNDVRLLRLQARIQMVKAQTEAARKILTVLSYDLVEGPWARGCLRRLDQDPQLAGDEEIQLLRRRMLRTDDMPVVSRGSQIVPNVEQALKSQLEQDPANRMAFEFLMAYYLCYSDLDHARQVLGGIKNMSGQGYLRPDGKRRTPQCYQEAMAILADKTETSVNVEGFEIEPQTIQRMKHFQQVIGQSPSRDAAFEALWKTYRGSYFFYVFFGPGDYR